jgi:hypothetical protein
VLLQGGANGESNCVIEEIRGWDYQDIYESDRCQWLANGFESFFIGISKQILNLFSRNSNKKTIKWSGNEMGRSEFDGSLSLSYYPIKFGWGLKVQMEV